MSNLFSNFEKEPTKIKLILCCGPFSCSAQIAHHLAELKSGVPNQPTYLPLKLPLSAFQAIHMYSWLLQLLYIFFYLAMAPWHKLYCRHIAAAYLMAPQRQNTRKMCHVSVNEL